MSSKAPQHQGNTPIDLSLPSPRAADFSQTIRALGEQGVLSHALNGISDVPDPTVSSPLPNLLLAISRQAECRTSPSVRADGRRRITRLFGIPAYGQLAFANSLGKSLDFKGLLSNSGWIHAESRVQALGSVFWAKGLDLLFSPQALWSMAAAAHEEHAGGGDRVVSSSSGLEWISGDVHKQMGLPDDSPALGSFVIIGACTAWLTSDEADAFGEADFADRLRSNWSSAVAQHGFGLPGVKTGAVSLGAPAPLGEALVHAAALQMVHGLTAMRHQQQPGDSEEEERPIEAGLFIGEGETVARISMSLRFHDGLTVTVGGLPSRLAVLGKEVVSAMRRAVGIPSEWLPADKLSDWANRPLPLQPPAHPSPGMLN